MDALTGIEDAVKTALTPMAPSLRTLDIYSGQLETDSLDNLIIQFPCIYILTTGIQIEVENFENFADIGVDLFIGDRNLRGAEAAIRGDGTSPGVYSIMQDAFDLLHNKGVYSEFALMQIESASPWIYRPKDGLCIWTQTYKIKGNIENG